MEKRNLAQRADPIYQDQNRGICPVSYIKIFKMCLILPLILQQIIGIC